MGKEGRRDRHSNGLGYGINKALSTDSFQEPSGTRDESDAATGKGSSAACSPQRAMMGTPVSCQRAGGAREGCGNDL